MTAKPLYQKVKDHILTRIGDGRFKPHDRIPSETQLVSDLKVSRMTVNRALKELSESGVLIRIAGVGTFVAEQRAHSELVSLRDIAEELSERGHRHDMRVLTHEEVAASREAAKSFDLTPGAPLFHARVLHFQDEVPVLLEDRLVNALLVPAFADADLTQATCHQHLMRLAPVEEVEHTIRAIAASNEIANQLQIPPGSPCLLVRRRTWARRQVATLAHLYHAGDRFEVSGRFKPNLKEKPHAAEPF